MRRKTIAILAALLLPFLTMAQGRATISGYITDASSGETLIGAGAVEGTQGAISNPHGFYTLTLPCGKHTISYSYVGYATQNVELLLSRDTTVNITLSPDQIKGSTVVASKDAGISSTKMSAIELPMAMIKNAPALFGEHDVLKTVQLMPGVQSGGDGFSGMYVRGGGPDENLLLLDGVGLYNAEHMLGIFSIFQSEAIKKVTLYKGSFPARYGGRISSIIDIRTNDGNMKEYSGTVGISVISDKLHIEGPIIKDKLAFSFSARGMHTMLLNKPILDRFGANYYFYDLNGKVTWRISDRDRVAASFYHGRDAFLIQSTTEGDTKTAEGTEGVTSTSTEDFDISWGNTLFATNWTHTFSNRLFANTTIAYTRYRMDVDMGVLSSYAVPGDETPTETRFKFNYNSGMRDYTAKMDFDFTPSPEHLIKFGVEGVHHVFYPQTGKIQFDQIGGITASLDTAATGQLGTILHGNELSFYAEDDFSIGERLNLNPGMKVALFFVKGKNYCSLEPRFSAKYDIGGGFSVKGAYSRMSQYVHLLSYSDISLPVDLWVPITSKIKPVTSDQVSLGVYHDGVPGWEFSLEGYYKWTHNVLEYMDGVSYMTDLSDWESCVEMGEGRSKGIEVFIEKKDGKTTGWLGYTLAWSDRIFSTINSGEKFPYKYDSRHNLSLVVNHQLTERLSLGATWTFATGGTMTLPERQTIAVTSDGTISQIALNTKRNNYRLPPTHKLNIGVNYTIPHKRGESTWSFSIYNVYDQMNATFVLNQSTSSPYIADVQKYTVKLSKFTLLPIIPSIGWTRKF